ncbi:hypothetical protein DL240_10615 [Lujinxingia litoralis]|uniref:Uncharacterized protein n=1 Tax=Lujinxingia litoralis TaxID=2211119 RepID=A0A328C5K6_9DELT|nr:hypothetical protein [Lujinxingia litoralis]RAL22296.1 hypothetical protein DL240_10615 [Lujinxingia litoralis]
MSERFEDVLFEGEDLRITLVVEEGAEVRVLLESQAGGPDLSVADEVIVVANGEGAAVQAESPRRAEALLGSEETLSAGAFSLMVRVHEFFEGWEFGEE